MTKMMLMDQRQSVRQLTHAADAIVALLRTVLRMTTVALLHALVLLAPRLAAGRIGRQAVMMIVAFVLALLEALAVFAPSDAAVWVARLAIVVLTTLVVALLIALAVFAPRLAAVRIARLAMVMLSALRRRCFGRERCRLGRCWRERRIECR